MRIVLAALMSFDALLCAYWLYPSPLAALAIPAVLASLMFARRPAAARWGWLALACVAVLVESHGPMRFLYFSGSCLLGWLFGLAVAEQDAEVLAEEGAVGALAAAYVGALLGKLATAGWVNGLQTVIAGQHEWGHSQLLDAATTYILEHRSVATTLGVFTLVAQASAALMPFSLVGRRIAASLLLLFHAGVYLLTPIFFPQAMVLLAAFGFRRKRELPPANVKRAVIAVAVVVVIAWLPPVRAFTHPARWTQAKPPSAETRTLLGDLVEGAAVGAFRIESIDQNQQAIRIVLRRGAETLLVELVPEGSRNLRAPLSAAGYDLFYEGDGDRTALDAIARRLRH